MNPKIPFTAEDDEAMQKFMYNQRVSNKVVMFAELPNKKRKIVRDDYNDNNDYEKDLMSKMRDQSQKKVRFVYDGGEKRDFGKTLAIRRIIYISVCIAEYKEKLVTCQD